MRFLLLSLLLAAASAQAQGTGTIAGIVRDADTGETLPGANVRIEGTTLGAAAYIDGRFTVRDVPAGTYAITASFIGYRYQTFSEVTVVNGYTADLSFGLEVETEISCFEYLSYYYAPLVPRGPFVSRVAVQTSILYDRCSHDSNLPRVSSGMGLRSGDS